MKDYINEKIIRYSKYINIWDSSNINIYDIFINRSWDNITYNNIYWLFFSIIIIGSLGVILSKKSDTFSIFFFNFSIFTCRFFFIIIKCRVFSIFIIYSLFRSNSSIIFICNYDV